MTLVTLKRLVLKLPNRDVVAVVVEENDRNVVAVVVVEGKQLKCGGGGKKNN